MRVWQAARRPEVLGLWALPQYGSLEEAARALRPRRIPSARAIQEALAALRATDEAPSDDDDGDGRARRRTALAQDGPEYFGFVG